jgi:hypothetical protein
MIEATEKPELQLSTLVERPYQHPPDLVFERRTYERKRVSLLGQAWQWPDGFYPFKTRREDDGTLSVGLHAYDRDAHEFTAYISERLLLKAALYLAEEIKADNRRNLSDEQAG